MIFHTHQISLVLFLFSIALIDHQVIAQKTDQARFIGYVVEPGEPVSAVYCPRVDNTLFKYAENSPFVYCDVNDDTLNVHGIRCNGPNVIVAGSFAGTLTVTCDQDWPCMTATMILPSLSSSSLSLISCQNSIGLSTRVSTIYWELPTDLVTTLPESATRTALHIAESNPSKDRNDDKGKENNTGVIVGAVIGGIAGLSLICGALFLGIRLGKKRSRKRNGRDDSEATRDDGSKFITQTARADKHSSQLEATDPGTMPVTMQNMNDGLVSNSYGRDVNAQRLLPELPTENTRHPRNGSTQELP